MEELNEEQIKNITVIANRIGIKAIMDALDVACKNATEELKKRNKKNRYKLCPECQAKKDEVETGGVTEKELNDSLRGL